MYTAKDVGDFFLYLSEPEVGDYLTSLQIQRLCYYAQGYSLALFDRAIFDEPIEAALIGPVIRSLQEYHLGYDLSQAFMVPDDFYRSLFAVGDQEVLKEVWESYGQFASWRLSRMARESLPYRHTRVGEHISLEGLRAFFRGEIMGEPVSNESQMQTMRPGVID